MSRIRYHSRNCCISSSQLDEVVSEDLFHRPERMVFSAVASCEVSHGSWPILGLMYLFSVVLILFTKFLKSRFKVFVKNLQFSIRLWVIWCRTDVVNPKLLGEYCPSGDFLLLCHYLIVWSEGTCGLAGNVLIEDVDNGICLFVRYGESF